MRFLLAILMLAGSWRAAAQGTFEAITGFNDNDTSGVVQGTAGWTFQVTNTVTVIELGCVADFFSSNGTTTPVQVGLWGSDASPLASVYVSPSSSLRGFSLYEPVTPVDIGPGVTYHVGVYFGGLFYSLNSALPAFGGSVTSVDEVVSVSAARTTTGWGSPPTLAGTLGGAYLGPNFIFRPVPEPSCGTLLVLGGLVLIGRKLSRRR